MPKRRCLIITSEEHHLDSKQLGSEHEEDQDLRVANEPLSKQSTELEESDPPSSVN